MGVQWVSLVRGDEGSESGEGSDGRHRDNIYRDWKLGNCDKCHHLGLMQCVFSVRMTVNLYVRSATYGGSGKNFMTTCSGLSY